MLYDLLSRLRGWVQLRWAEMRGETVVHRRRRRKHRHFTDGRDRPRLDVRRLIPLAGAAACGVMFVVGAVNLIGYGIDYVSSALTSQKMRQTYYEVLTEVPFDTPGPLAAPAQQGYDTAAAVTTQVVFAQDTAQMQYVTEQQSGTVADSAQTDDPQILQTYVYPKNLGLKVNSRFQEVRQYNKDIVGWLRIDGLIDEPVVKRDNVYYMSHDYRGNENVNGAIFLDEIIGLEKRPYTLLLYGHNMKTGAMFGSLRNYENLEFYKRNPIFSFDSIYEDGRYVIFSVAMVSVADEDGHYLDVSKLVSNSVTKRRDVLDMLCDASAIDTGISVAADDQVILLVTCVGNTDERRVIAARRVREGEDEVVLWNQAQHASIK